MALSRQAIFLVAPHRRRESLVSNRSTHNSVLRPFGRQGAARYDADTSGMPRRYKTAHSIQNELVFGALQRKTLTRQVVLDLGCGTANDGLDILSRTSNSFYLGVDYSQHMLAGAAKKIASVGYQHRSALLERDFRELTEREISTALDKANITGKISCAISAIALHHYELGQKQGVYQLVFDLLPRGGLFILTDLYSNGIDRCAELAWRKEVSDIRRAVEGLNKREQKYHGPSTISVRHYVEENRPQILSEEIALLRRIGFSEIDVVYRYAQLGVIVIER